MCRVLFVQSVEEFPLEKFLTPFAHVCERSSEYQGHGWGWVAYRDGKWSDYRSVTPIWEDTQPEGGRATILLAHARSAFQNEGIVVENNMPFSDEPYHFAFNGELRGVRIQSEGRIGAEKIFNFSKRFFADDLPSGLQRGMDIIEKRTRYVRAMNTLVTTKNQAVAYCRFSEQPEYFTLYESVGHERIVCSEPLNDDDTWSPFQNGELRSYTFYTGRE